MTRLVLFDCDGTLVDSAQVIVACMQAAFAAHDLAPPSPEAVRRIVGRSLVEAIGDLLPASDAAARIAMAESYKRRFHATRLAEGVTEPLFPGALAVLETLKAQERLQGVVTGKTMRGLEAVLDHHGLRRFFVTLQTADLHPSKPHPAMVEAAMAATGSLARETVVIGDTSFDVLMARHAGARAIGVAWGNHPPDELLAAGAERVLDDFAELLDLLEAG